jgi:WD40 repeat protein
VGTGCWDKYARLWDVETGKSVGKPLEHPSAVVQVEFSPDERTLLTRDYDHGLLWFWDVARGFSRREHWGIDGITCRFSDATFSKDGRFLLSTEERSGCVRIWDLASNKPVGSPVRHPLVSKVAFGPDGQSLLTASAQGPVLLWSLEEKKPARHLPVGLGSRLVLSPDGKLVLVSNQQEPNTKALWDVAGGKLLHRFPHKEELLRRSGRRTPSSKSRCGTPRREKCFVAC